MPAHENPLAADEPCPRLSRLAADVREIVHSQCPACQGTGPACAVECLDDLAGDGAPEAGRPAAAPDGQ